MGIAAATVQAKQSHFLTSIGKTSVVGEISTGYSGSYGRAISSSGSYLSCSAAPAQAMLPPLAATTLFFGLEQNSHNSADAVLSGDASMRSAMQENLCLMPLSKLLDVAWPEQNKAVNSSKSPRNLHRMNRHAPGPVLVRAGIRQIKSGPVAAETVYRTSCSI
mmetsp:Transcript_99242/g.155158  ORF Transcript_99242/g.155158 Transcript_99242/m.155158 type:complete len:163 (-) Transcript_99242:193-681(-)